VEHSLREPAQGGRQMGSSAVTSEPAPEPECGWNLSSHSTNSCSLRQKPIYAGQEVLDRKFRKLYHHSVCALCTRGSRPRENHFAGLTPSFTQTGWPCCLRASASLRGRGGVLIAHPLLHRLPTVGWRSVETRPGSSRAGGRFVCVLPLWWAWGRLDT